MTEGIILLVLGLTVLAFVLKHAILHMACVPAWIFLGFFLWNQTDWPAGNTFLQYACMLLCIIMVVVNIVVTVNHYLGQRTVPPTHDQVQRSHRKTVLSLTKKKKEDLPPWY